MAITSSACDQSDSLPGLFQEYKTFSSFGTCARQKFGISPLYSGFIIKIRDDTLRLCKKLLETVNSWRQNDGFMEKILAYK